MYEQLKSRIIELLAQPRALKPQAERQIVQLLQEHGGEMGALFARAAEILPEDQLEILFAPQFTPNLDDQAAVSEILSKWRPTAADLTRLAADIGSTAGAMGAVELPDASVAKFPLHAVMIERFVKLLRLDQAPDVKTVEVLQDALPTELYTLAAAFLRQRGFTPERQRWYASFVRHLAHKFPVTPAVLAGTAQFVTNQSSLEHAVLLTAVEELIRAAKNSVEYVQAGRMYWSPDVAQHHQNRGQGKIDVALVKQRREELTALETIEAALKTFEGPKG